MKSHLAVSMRAALCVLGGGLLALVLTVQMTRLAWSQTPRSLDAPLHYTVKVISATYGDAAETHSIASGAVEDFTWKREPLSGAVLAEAQCPRITDMPLNANHEMLQQIKVRLAPVVGLDRMVSIQLSFSAHTPQGSYVHTLKQGQKIHCPVDLAHQEIVRFKLPLDGVPRKIELSDGTHLFISVKH